MINSFFDLKEKYDVIIVGGGPASLECAKILNNSNYSVLLIEKNFKIGPKICAGALGFKNSFDLNKDDYLNFKFSNFYFDGELEKKTYSKSLITISREKFGQNQFSNIKNSKNISILTSVIVNKISNQKIGLNFEGKQKSLNFDFLVGGDGANSIVRKYLKLPTKVLTTMQYVINKKFEKMEYFYTFEKLRLGYIWIFPHLNSTYIGIGFDANIISTINAKLFFDDFLIKKKIIIEKNVKLQSAPIAYNYCGYDFKNIFLIGEAAGFVSYFTGGGIIPAIVSGCEVGKKLLDENYEMPNMKNLIKYKLNEKLIIKNQKYFDKKHMKYIVSKMFNVGGK